MTIAHPVAPTAEAALHAPLGHAVRESEARAVAGEAVELASAWVGPAFATRAAAEEAYAERLAQPWCEVRPILAPGARPAPPARAAMKDGVRWSPPEGPGPAFWRLHVSFWRMRAPVGETDLAPLDPARRLRRSAASASGLDAHALRRLAAQPLQAIRPQQPLDIGLFERPLPEAPGQLIPDE